MQQTGTQALGPLFERLARDGPAIHWFPPASLMIHSERQYHVSRMLRGTKDGKAERVWLL